MAGGDESPDEIADLYLRLAEACYASDADDASGYFSEAIDALSKCGEELLPRWSAVTAIARRLSRSDACSAVPRKLVYDFTRCGEYVRRCVCRDKYYNRDEVFSILVDFDPAYAWATYSRWRDRGVGSFSYDIGWITETLIDKGVLSLEEAWTLREFGDSGVWNKLRNTSVRAEVPAELKREALDVLLRSCRKNGCSKRDVDLIKALAKEFHISLPTWIEAYKDPQESLWRECAKEDSEQQFSQAPDYDGKDPDWAHNTLGKRDRLYWTDRCREVFFSKVPENFACPFLRSVAADKRINRYDIREVIYNLPSYWSKKPGVRKAMHDVLSRLVARSVEDRAYDNVAVFVERAKDYGLERNVAECFLKCMANADHLGSEDYYQLVKQGLPVLSQTESEALFQCVLERASVGMPEDFGDGSWNEELWPKASFGEIAKDVLWTAMGDPDVGLRWDATHCVVGELLRIPDEMVGAGVSRLFRTDFVPCVSRKLPFYFDFARMHFLLALAKVSTKIAPAIRKHADELIGFLRKQEHVLIRYLGWQTLVGAGIAEKELSRINPLGDENIREIEGCAWGVEVEMDSTVRDAMKRGGWFPTHYDFDKYWVPSLLSVFGLDKDECRSLLTWAVQDAKDGHWSWARNQDPRNDQFHNDRSTEVSEYEMPEKSDYNFYVAYNALMVLAGRLLKCQSVIKEVGDSEDRFSIWMREILPVFSPDSTMWHSDLRGALPMRILRQEDLREDVEEKPLRELDLEQLLGFSADEGEFSIDGFWRIGDYPKELECSLSCALVATKDAERVREHLSRMKNPYSLALPTLFDHPNGDWRNHGKFPWRGLFDAEQSYPRYHLDERDPRACGLRLTFFHVAKTIRNDLGLKTCADHVSLAFTDGGLAFGAHYWGRELHSREETPGTYGATLNVTREALRALCDKYQSELIVELVLKRYKRGYYHDFYRREDEEKCYRYALISPDRGVW